MVEKIVVMVDGGVSELGSYDELLSHDGPFAQFLKTYFTQEEQDTDEEEDEDPESITPYFVKFWKKIPI